MNISKNAGQLGGERYALDPVAVINSGMRCQAGPHRRNPGVIPPSRSARVIAGQNHSLSKRDVCGSRPGDDQPVRWRVFQGFQAVVAAVDMGGGGFGPDGRRATRRNADPPASRPTPASAKRRSAAPPYAKPRLTCLLTTAIRNGAAGGGVPRPMGGSRAPRKMVA